MRCARVWELKTLLVALFIGLGNATDLGGDIELRVHGIPSTWTGDVSALVNPRDDPTHEAPFEFRAEPLNATVSVVHAATEASNDNQTTLADFDGYRLDIFVEHGDTLWPCVAADGIHIRNLHVTDYSTNATYHIDATYKENVFGEYYFSCTEQRNRVKGIDTAMPEAF